MLHVYIIGLPEVKKQFYIEDPAISGLTPDEVQEIRYNVNHASVGTCPGIKLGYTVL